MKAVNMEHRVSIQNYDWGALRLVQAREPGLQTVALTNKDFLQTGQPGA
jgi:glycerophosphoryl diester phosphodiesterase